MVRTTTEHDIDRRAYLAALASGGAVSLAGCLGDDDGDSGDSGDSGDNDDGDSDADSDGDPSEQGERVPELTIEYFAGLGNYTASLADIADIASNNIEERLGVPVNIGSKEFITLYEERTSDSRNAHLYPDGNSPNPGNLDPTTLGDLYHIQYAGDVDGFNPTHYANCEYSNLMEDARFATSEDAFQEATTEAQQVFSADVGQWLLMPFGSYYAINTNQVVADEDLLGEQGLSGYNYDFRTNMEAAGDVTPSINVDAVVLRTLNFPMITHPSHTDWANLVHSPLFRIDQNYERVPVLADEFEVENDFQQVTISIRDAVFHDGSTITAEDVKFTWDLYYSPYDNYVGAEPTWQIDSIEVIDEKTVQFNFPAPTPVFMQRGDITGFGILKKDLWDPKLDDNFENLPEINFNTDEMVGSGPYELDTFEVERFASLTPFDGHHETPNQNLRLQAYTDAQAANRDFEQGNLSIYTTPNATQIRDLAEMDHIHTHRGEAFTAYHMYPQMSFPPFQFREMRLAGSQALDRREMSEVVTHGDSEPMLYANIFSSTNPEFPDEGMTQISPAAEGSEEAARETLREAGYTWDDDDRLRYPPDKDLTPPWPQGESPMEYPDEWPCVEDIPEGY